MVSKEFVQDVWSTAMVGIDYWAHVEYIKRNPDNQSYLSVLVRDNEDPDGDWHVIDEDVIRRGVALFVEQGRKYSEYVEVEDEGMVDADVADIIVQLGLFGAEVYA